VGRAAAGFGRVGRAAAGFGRVGRVAGFGRVGRAAVGIVGRPGIVGMLGIVGMEGPFPIQSMDFKMGGVMRGTTKSLYSVLGEIIENIEEISGGQKRHDEPEVASPDTLKILPGTLPENMKL